MAPGAEPGTVSVVGVTYPASADPAGPRKVVDAGSRGTKVPPALRLSNCTVYSVPTLLVPTVRTIQGRNHLLDSELFWKCFARHGPHHSGLSFIWMRH